MIYSLQICNTNTFCNDFCCVFVLFFTQDDCALHTYAESDLHSPDWMWLQEDKATDGDICEAHLKGN